MSSASLSRRILSLCDEALAIAPERREAFVRGACANDPRLRASVDSVLLAVERSGDFLSGTADEVAHSQQRTGEKIGPYRIAERLGEGGMGTVYLAERDDNDFCQRVAVKFVRGHMLAREVIERFHTERRILATLSHPYIAALIDGGTTDDGAPYLVMEYIDGMPIDRYCDDNKLNIEERLRLIRKVATAVQAAHRNLIVHRDLKPSNVLVTTDGIPKLLDFGIAKLVSADGEQTSGNTTIFGHQALTPDYASPEQILFGKVTTVSDVYSLGVLTYQLLSGSRPYHLDTENPGRLLASADAAAVRRASTQVLNVARTDEAKQIAAQRATTPLRLARRLAGDLDTILLKALHREPDRRYESAGAFSDDIERYLNNLPIEARADSLRYRLRKFVGRYRLTVTAAGVALVAVVAGLILALWQAGIARQQSEAAQTQLARAEAVSRYLGDILLSPSTNWDAAIQTGPDATIGDILTAAENQLDNDLLDQPEVRIELYNKISEARSRMEHFEHAVVTQSKAVALAEGRLPDSLSALTEVYYFMGSALHNAGHHEAAIVEFEKALAHADRMPDRGGLRRLYILNDLAVAYADIDRADKALMLQEAAFAVSHEMFGDQQLPLLTNGYNNLGLFQYLLGRLDDASRSYKKGIEAHLAFPEQTEFAGGVLYMHLASLRMAQWRHAEAIDLLETAAPLFLAAGPFGDEDGALAQVLNVFAHALQEHPVRATALLEGISQKRRDLLAAKYPWALPAAQALVAWQDGDHAQALRDLNRARVLADTATMSAMETILLQLVVARIGAGTGNMSDATAAYDNAMETAARWLGKDALLLAELQRERQQFDAGPDRR